MNYWEANIVLERQTKRTTTFVLSGQISGGTQCDLLSLDLSFNKTRNVPAAKDTLIYFVMLVSVVKVERTRNSILEIERYCT